VVLFISFLIDCFLSDTPIDEMSILEAVLHRHRAFSPSRKRNCLRLWCATWDGQTCAERWVQLSTTGGQCERRPFGNRAVRQGSM